MNQRQEQYLEYHQPVNILIVKKLQNITFIKGFEVRMIYKLPRTRKSTNINIGKISLKNISGIVVPCNAKFCNGLITRANVFVLLPELNKFTLFYKAVFPSTTIYYQL